MKSLIKNGLFILSLALIVWFGYIVFYRAEPATLSESTQSDARIKQEEFLVKLKELQGLHLNADFFKGKNFMSLVDYSIQVVNEPAGRPNPFAPVPGLVTKPVVKK